MTASLLFSMFKTKTKFPLHSAIRLQREDVVFLYLIEFNQQVNKFHYVISLMLHLGKIYSLALVGSHDTAQVEDYRPS
jgi:hypothetical protein